MTETLKDPRFILAALFLALIATSFWAGSRVPDLNEKAMMGGDIRLQDQLSFDAKFPITSDMTVVSKIAYSTLNWISTNQKGMTFGLLFGAAFMTMLALFQRRSFKSGFANSVLGLVIGAPLGVCVNCAAPVALGMHSGGTRIETTLAAMISSPTLNVIVLTMLFALFPVYVVVIKLGLTVFFILFVIPILCRTLFPNEIVRSTYGLPGASDGFCEVPLEAKTDPGIWPAVKWFVVNYGKNLWFVVQKAVPLMLLAGFLGSVLTTLLPWDTVVDHMPRNSDIKIMLMIGALALFGLFLPVPIAFDVVVSAMLLAAGVPIGYVMALLFTLGIYSVFSWSIIGKAVSFRVANVLAVVLVIMGIVAGITALIYGNWSRDNQRTFMQTVLASYNFENPDEKPMGPDSAGSTLVSLSESLAEGALIWQSTGSRADGLQISFQQLSAPQVSDSATQFVKHEGSELGLHKFDNTSPVQKMVPPYMRSWSVASGDIHNDGWQDLLIGSPHGLLLYANERGEGFVQQSIESSEVQAMYASNAALVDMNNDGWLDIVIASYSKGNYVVYSDRGNFDGKGLVKLPGPLANQAQGLGFGDVNVDGHMDIVVGNWSTGMWTTVPPVDSQNYILRGVGNRQFEVDMLPGAIGETLSSLVTDYDDDGYPELLIGNDFQQPDIVYVGGPDGLEMKSRADTPFAYLTTTTMSIDTADLNNDLKLDVFHGQITGKSPADQRKLHVANVENYCEQVDPLYKGECEVTSHVVQTVRRATSARDAKKCLELHTDVDKVDCVAYQLISQAAGIRRTKSMLQFSEERDLCASLTGRWENLGHICEYAYRPPAYDKEDPIYETSIRQIEDFNVVHMQSADGSFVEQGKDLGLAVTGWTWNAKFADFDNDGWQDLFSANGVYFANLRESNVFFRNNEGRSFSNETESFGLIDYRVGISYTKFDMDNDGDLDMVLTPTVGEAVVYENTESIRPGIVFELRDSVGNSYGVGSKVVIHYANGKHQLRELKASGGHMSYDPVEAFFGLGEHQSVDSVEVVWSTGEKHRIDGPFPAGNRYRIERTDASLGVAAAGATGD